jgi:hypothetical protein
MRRYSPPKSQVPLREEVKKSLCHASLAEELPPRAAGVPVLAKQNGAKLIILNRDHWDDLYETLV